MIVSFSCAAFVQGSRFESNVQNGDINGDGRRNITDVITLVDAVFGGGGAPVPAMCGYAGDNSGRSWRAPVRNGDVNGDGRLDASDVVSLVHWLYAGGSAPADLRCDAEVPN